MEQVRDRNLQLQQRISEGASFGHAQEWIATNLREEMAEMRDQISGTRREVEEFGRARILYDERRGGSHARLDGGAEFVYQAGSRPPSYHTNNSEEEV